MDRQWSINGPAVTNGWPGTGPDAKWLSAPALELNSRNFRNPSTVRIRVSDPPGMTDEAPAPVVNEMRPPLVPAWDRGHWRQPSNLIPEISGTSVPFASASATLRA